MKSGTEYLREAQHLVDRAEIEGRGLSDLERQSAEQALKRCGEIRGNRKMVDSIERMNGNFSASGGGEFAQSVVSAGFNLKSNPSVTIPLRSALGKAPTLPAVGDWNLQAPTLVPMGRDERFLNANLVQESVDGETAIQDFRQTARTVTGSVQRAMDASTTKAALDVTLSLVTETLVQQAIIIPDIRNAIFEAVPSLRNFLNSEGVFQINKSLDAHAMSQIVASSPPFGQTGSELVTKLRNAVASMRAEGAAPSLVVLSPSDAATLDLQADTSGFIFPLRDTGSASPLWGLRVVERIGAGTEAPVRARPRDVGSLLHGHASFRGRPVHGILQKLVDAQSRAQGALSRPQRQGRAQGGGVVKYEVQGAPVSYKDRLLSKGETFEASEEEARRMAAGRIRQAARGTKGVAHQSKK